MSTLKVKVSYLQKDEKQ